MTTLFGWIPNVAGKLSFTLSGTSAYPRRFHHSANIASGGRYFAGFQYRNLSDTTFPFFSDWPMIRSAIDSLVFNKDGNFVFLCLLKVTADRETAKGRIYAYNRVQWQDASGTLNEKLRAVPELWSDETVLHEELPSEALAKSSYSGRFSIERNGIIALETLTMPSPNGAGVPAVRLEHAFAAQSYFCLRDLLHTHRFHSPSSDTIIDVYPDLETLKKQVNYGLMRRAIAARRVQTTEAQHRALGIISYLRSFRENIMTENERQALSFSMEATIESIKAGLPLISGKESRSLKNRLDRFRTATIAFISALFFYAALIKDSKVLVPDELSWLRATFEFVQERFGIALICVVLIIWFLQVLLSVKFEQRDRVTRTSSRLALAFRVRRYAVFEIAAGLAFFALAMLLVGLMFYRALSGPDA